MSEESVAACGLPLRVDPDGPRRTPWAILLAGGEGTRMRPTIRRWLGEDRPKQFCTFTGTRSMLQHTLDRALSVVAADRVVTVIRDGQQRFLADAVVGPPPGHVLVQPADGGTAAAVFTALTAIRAVDSDATVVVLPSDHFVHPERAFVRDLIHACLFAEHFPERLVLLGARPEGPEPDYGWIGPGPAESSALARFLQRNPAVVRHFVEKPTPREARALQKRGYLWNTGVAAARAGTLWAIGRAVLGSALDRFDTLGRVLGAIRARRAPVEHARVMLKHAFTDLAPIDFSRDLCQHAEVARASLVLPLREVQWSDWGRPERIHASLATLGRPAPLPSVAFNGDPVIV